MFGSSIHPNMWNPDVWKKIRQLNGSKLKECITGVKERKVEERKKNNRRNDRFGTRERPKDDYPYGYQIRLLIRVWWITLQRILQVQLLPPRLFEISLLTFRYLSLSPSHFSLLLFSKLCIIKPIACIIFALSCTTFTVYLYRLATTYGFQNLLFFSF